MKFFYKEGWKDVVLANGCRSQDDYIKARRMSRVSIHSRLPQTFPVAVDPAALRAGGGGRDEIAGCGYIQLWQDSKPSASHRHPINSKNEPRAQHH